MAKKPVTIEVGGIVATGATKKEAEQKLFEKLEEALDGFWTPFLITFRGHGVMVYRTPQGWWWQHFTLIDNGDVKFGGVSTTQGDHREAVAAAASHLAQCGWDGQEDDSPVFDQAARQVGEHVVKSYRSEFQYWTHWQKKYREAVEKGMSDMDARSYADSLKSLKSYAESAEVSGGV